MLTPAERAQAEAGNPFGWLEFYGSTHDDAETFDAYLKAREYLRILRGAV